MDIHHNQGLTSSQTEPERRTTLSLPSSLQLPPNLRVSCRVAPRTIQLGVVRAGPLSTGFTLMGQLGFKAIWKEFSDWFCLGFVSFQINAGLGWHWCLLTYASAFVNWKFRRDYGEITVGTTAATSVRHTTYLLWTLLFFQCDTLPFLISL